jgi:hypothetical protein
MAHGSVKQLGIGFEQFVEALESFPNRLTG